MRIKHKLHRALNMIVDSEKSDYPRPGFGLLVCPLCGFGYVHCEGVETVPGNDNYEAWEGRGDAIKIKCWCEDGHDWWICFGFHKGNTFVWTEFEKNGAKE